MTSLGRMCSTSPSLAHRTSSHMLVELAAYRITQQVPHDDAIVRCRYTVSAEEVFRLLQTLCKIYLLTRSEAGKRMRLVLTCMVSWTGIQCYEPLFSGVGGSSPQSGFYHSHR
ncbi:hypothetical protein T03_15224 [Trichinella britovi]|uniref:Uncharacterized protein n=1 Tax=Trichinella britovi TaxID=45882 RepID=A0A0V1C879_TRIBR|nr:hypothetical protein T03_15224 [Trichinella britovi]